MPPQSVEHSNYILKPECECVWSSILLYFTIFQHIQITDLIISHFTCYNIWRTNYHCIKSRKYLVLDSWDWWAVILNITWTRKNVWMSDISNQLASRNEWRRIFSLHKHCFLCHFLMFSGVLDIFSGWMKSVLLMFTQVYFITLHKVLIIYLGQ